MTIFRSDGDSVQKLANDIGLQTLVRGECADRAVSEEQDSETLCCRAVRGKAMQELPLLASEEALGSILAITRTTSLCSSSEPPEAEEVVRRP